MHVYTMYTTVRVPPLSMKIVGGERGREVEGVSPSPLSLVCPLACLHTSTDLGVFAPPYPPPTGC